MTDDDDDHDHCCLAISVSVSFSATDCRVVFHHVGPVDAYSLNSLKQPLFRLTVPLIVTK